MIDTGCCAYVLLTESNASAVQPQLAQSMELTDTETVALIAYFSALHDIGKCHPVFQKNGVELEIIEPLIRAGLMKTGGLTNNFRHELYTKEILKRIWTEKALITSDYIETLSTVLSMHHQGKHGDSAVLLSSVKAEWECFQDEMELEIRNIFKPPLNRLQQCKSADGAAMLIMGLTILSDWIASGEYFCELDAQTDSDYREAAIKAAQKAIRAYGLTQGMALPAFSDFCELWPQIDRTTLRPIQTACETAAARPNAFYLIEAPMGEGKTEAAVYLASHMMREYGKTGIYVALPTSATSNQMNGRINQLFTQHALPPSRLLHSMAWLVDEISAENPIQSEEASVMSLWLKPLRRGLLSQNAVGTVDQALAAVLMVKYTVLRLLGLAEKVLIIDEIHAYDAYMDQMIERLLSWCRVLNIPVVLLSATLPKEKKIKLLEACGARKGINCSDNYPLISSVDAAGKLIEIETEACIRRQYCFKQYRILNDYTAVTELAVELYEEGCVCIMLNTVSAAQEMYRRIKSSISQDVQLLLFHARFTARRRQEIENECIRLFGKNSMERPHKAVLICTQVVEQSLDVDFDSMITEIAPIDLLLQRAGRVHRHDCTVRPPKLVSPTVHVLVPNGTDYKGTEAVYEKLLLERTRKYLGNSRIIRVPEDIRDTIEAVYTNKVEEDEAENSFRAELEKKMMRSRATGVILEEPHEEYFFATESNSVQSLFTRNDDEDSVGRAKTRMGSETIRVVLAERVLYEKLKENTQDIHLAREALMSSVSVNAQKLGALPENQFVEQGLLRGCLIVPIDDSGNALCNCRKIHYDDETGIKIERM